MEGSEKINGRKKMPSIPANFVTLLQLQERWIKEKEGKQKKGNEEKQEPQQGGKEDEAKVEEQVKDVVARRRSRRNGHFHRLNKEKDGKQKGKEEKEKEEEEPQQGEENKEKVEERVNDEVARRGSRKNGDFRRLNKEKDVKQNGQIEEPQQGQEENEATVEVPVNDEVARRGGRKNEKYFPRDRNNGKRFVEKKPEEEKIENSESEGVQKEEKSKELKAEKKKRKKKKRPKMKNHHQEEKSRENDRVEEVDELPLNAPMPASVVKEVFGDEPHEVKLTSVEEENVKATRELKPRIIPRTDDDRMAEVGQKFGTMSLKDAGQHYRYGRRYRNFNHFERDREPFRRYYRGFDRSRELNHRNEGMVWVKKGEVNDGNIS